MLPEKVTIYSATGCLYAHRTRLALRQLGINFSLTEIDLEHKPDWFTEISPYSKVSVIKHGKNRAWESPIINEYLNEVFPTPPLMPTDPGQTVARIWIDFVNVNVPTFYKLLLNQEQEKQ